MASTTDPASAGAQSRSVESAHIRALKRLFGLHLLAHVPGLPRSLRAVRLGSGRSLTEGSPGGAAGRWLALASMLVGGAVVAIVLIPHFSLWTAAGAFPHHHHEH